MEGTDDELCWVRLELEILTTWGMTEPLAAVDRARFEVIFRRERELLRALGSEG